MNKNITGNTQMLKKGPNKALADHALWTGTAGQQGARANLRDADLTGTSLTGANLTRADLTGANLTGANLTGTSLTWANLKGANLTGTSLTWANLKGANLTGADLTGANLKGANLKGANLTWANLKGANLTGAKFTWPAFRLDFGTWSTSFNGTHIQVGCQVHSLKQWEEFTDEEIADMEEGALEFCKNYKNLLLGLARQVLETRPNT